MAIAPSTVTPARAVDAGGRALPMIEAEIRARAEIATRTLGETASVTDEADTVEVWDRFERGIGPDDSSRGRVQD